MPHDAFSFSSWGVHSDSSRTSFPSQCSATWHSFMPLEICFFYTLLPKCDLHIVPCLHRIFYLTRFVVLLHLCDTPPQWQVLLYLLRPLPSRSLFHGKRHWQNKEELLESRVSYQPPTSGQDWWALGALQITELELHNACLTASLLQY